MEHLPEGPSAPGPGEEVVFPTGSGGDGGHGGSGVGIRGLLDQRPKLPPTAVNRGGHMRLKPPKDPKAMQGLWWVYRPTPELQKDRMSKLSQPKKTVTKVDLDEAPQTAIDWVIHRAKQMPGPGEYDPETPSRLRYFGAFNASKPKTELEWTIYYAQEKPGPGTYDLSQTEKTPGGRFNESKAKTMIEWVEYYAKDLPGPAEYDVRGTPGDVSGGRFNLSAPKSEIDWLIYHSKALPGPGTYETRKPLTASGGRFNMSQPKSYIDWDIYRAKTLPGPGDYKVPDLASTKRGGGRFNESNPKSDLEWKIYYAQEIPGPGQYDPKLAGTFTNPFAETGSLDGGSTLSRQASMGSSLRGTLRHTKSMSSAEMSRSQSFRRQPKSPGSSVRLEPIDEMTLADLGAQGGGGGGGPAPQPHMGSEAKGAKKLKHSATM